MSDEDLLRKQSQLLAQREAELNALRRQHERALSWWSTFHALESDLDAQANLPSTCDRWCGLLVDELDFQAAAVLRIGDDAVETLSWPSHLGEPPAAIAGPELVAELRARRGGLLNAPEGPLAALAGALRLERFLWCTIGPRPDLELLALAGFDARAARFRVRFVEADVEQFQWVARHLETVLRNVMLMQTLAQHERVQQMHEALARQREELEERLMTITAQAETIRQLSTPVLELWDGVLVLPIIGAIDQHRAGTMMEGLLTRLAATRARSVILDVTGVDALDAAAADHVLRVTRAAALLGAQCVLTGVRPAVADTLVGLGVGFSDLRAFRDLRAGLRHCLQERR